jgi:hypothetical protein
MYESSSTGNDGISPRTTELGAGDPGFEWFRADHLSKNKTSTPLSDHPAVLSYRQEGVSTDSLVSFIESFASLRASRVKKIGHQQYSLAQGQKFETFSAEETIKELIEELADAGNYIDFLAIKLLNLVSTIEQSDLYCD